MQYPVDPSGIRKDENNPVARRVENLVRGGEKGTFFCMVTCGNVASSGGNNTEKIWNALA